MTNLYNCRNLPIKANLKTLTVGRLEISVNKRDRRPIMEVVHASGNLNGPVNQDLGANLATSKNSKTECLMIAIKTDLLITC